MIKQAQTVPSWPTWTFTRMLNGFRFVFNLVLLCMKIHQVVFGYNAFSPPALIQTTCSGHCTELGSKLSPWSPQICLAKIIFLRISDLVQCAWMVWCFQNLWYRNIIQVVDESFMLWMIRKNCVHGTIFFFLDKKFEHWFKCWEVAHVKHLMNNTCMYIPDRECCSEIRYRKISIKWTK